MNSSSARPLFSTASSFFPPRPVKSASKPPPASFFDDVPTTSAFSRPQQPTSNAYRPQQQPYGYVPNKQPAVIPGALFPVFNGAGGTKYNSAFPPEKKQTASYSSSSAPQKMKPVDSDEGEDFDVAIAPTSREDFETVDDADKHMRELLEGALGEEAEYDVSRRVTLCDFRDRADSLCVSIR